MSCDEIKNLLDEYISGELDDTAMREVEQHLAACNACNAEYNALKALREELGSLAEPLPEEYEARLIGKIRRHKRTRLINVLGASVAAAVVLVCAVGIGMDELRKYMVDRGSISEQFANAGDVNEYNKEDNKEVNKEDNKEDNKENVIDDSIEDSTEINHISDSATANTEDKGVALGDTLNEEVGVAEAPQNTVQPATDSHSASTESMAIAEVQPEVTSVQSGTAASSNGSNETASIKRAYAEDTEDVAEYEACADIYLCIDEADFAELKTKLDTMFASEQLDYSSDGVLIHVTDMDYNTFRDELKDFSMDYDRDQINNIDEKSLNYRVSVSVAKKW